MDSSPSRAVCADGRFGSTLDVIRRLPGMIAARVGCVGPCPRGVTTATTRNRWMQRIQAVELAIGDDPLAR